MDKLYDLRLQMKQLGWESEDSLTPMGWKNGYGYTIWFRRYDWHGKNAVSITGHEVCFYESEKHGADYNAVYKAVKKCADKAVKAWNDFPKSIPCQNINGISEDIMCIPFENGKTSIRYKNDLTMDLTNGKEI